MQKPIAEYRRHSLIDGIEYELKRSRDLVFTEISNSTVVLQKKVKRSELSGEGMLNQLADLRDAYPEFFLDGIKIKVRKTDGLTPAQMADYAP